MYYPEEVIEEVRTRNDIVDIISGYVKLQKKGSNYFGLCPFHHEKSPSFSVSQSKQMYHCFGCGVSGNVFTFVMEYEIIRSGRQWSFWQTGAESSFPRWNIQRRPRPRRI